MIKDADQFKDLLEAYAAHKGVSGANDLAKMSFRKNSMMHWLKLMRSLGNGKFVLKNEYGGTESIAFFLKCYKFYIQKIEI